MAFVTISCFLRLIYKITTQNRFFMRHKSIFSLSFLSFLILFVGCSISIKDSNHSDDTDYTTDTITTVTTPLTIDVKTLVATAGMPVKYIVSDKNCVTIQALQSVVEKISVSQNGSVLSISPKNSISLKKIDSHLSINVYAPAITEFNASAGASIKADRYQLPTLTTDAASGAEIEFDSINTTTVTASVSSGAEIELDGSCNSVDLTASSGGEIDVDDLLANSGLATASSGGNIKCKVKSLQKSTSAGGSVKNVY